MQCSPKHFQRCISYHFQMFLFLEFIFSTVVTGKHFEEVHNHAEQVLAAFPSLFLIVLSFLIVPFLFLLANILLLFFPSSRITLYSFIPLPSLCCFSALLSFCHRNELKMWLKFHSWCSSQHSFDYRPTWIYMF